MKSGLLQSSLSKWLILKYPENLVLVSSFCKVAVCKSSTSMKIGFAEDVLR